MSRWVWRIAALALLAAGGSPRLLCGQDARYPHKTVTIICPWAPGGGTDRVARFWADALQRKLGQPVVVVNRTGGAGAVGHFSGAHARPDGYTITIITFELSTMHRMRISRLTYKDYECLLQMNADPAAIVVQADAPWHTLADWLADVRAHPGQIKMSGTATGGAWDLARAGLLRAAGVPIESVIWVPHPGANPSLMELMGGHLDAVCCSVPEVAAQLEGGQIRILAVMADQRLADFPELPTAKEQGVDWVAVGWRGLALPKGTPPAIVATLQEHCDKIAHSDEFKGFMSKNGFGIEIRMTDEFTSFLAAQDAQWKGVVEAAGYDHGLTGNNDPGPLALPLVLCIGLLVAGGWEFFQSRRHRSEAPATSWWQPKVLGTGVALVGYVVAVHWLGFALSTIAFLALTTRAFGARWWSAVVASLLIMSIVWLMFTYLFEVQLPHGTLGLPL